MINAATWRNRSDDNGDDIVGVYAERINSFNAWLSIVVDTHRKIYGGKTLGFTILLATL